MSFQVLFFLPFAVGNNVCFYHNIDFGEETYGVKFPFFSMMIGNLFNRFAYDTNENVK